MDKLKKLAEGLRIRLAAPIDLPEPGQRLGLQKREGQPERQFKHIHQMSMGHVEHLALSCEFKLLALLEGYLVASTGSAIGCYLFARTVLEQCAFTIELQRRLSAIAAKSDTSWLPKGEEFFALVVRFRFATGDKELQKRLERVGFPPKLLKPVNVMNCVAALSTSPEVQHLGPVYDTLCDFVHHNGPSHFTASSGFFIGAAGIHHGSGGGVLLREPAPITRYEYPNPRKLSSAVADTKGTVALAAEVCLQTLGKVPRSPYSPDAVRKMTGNEMGMTHLGQDQSMKRTNT